MHLSDRVSTKFGLSQPGRGDRQEQSLLISLLVIPAMLCTAWAIESHSHAPLLYQMPQHQRPSGVKRSLGSQPSGSQLLSLPPLCQCCVGQRALPAGHEPLLEQLQIMSQRMCQVPFCCRSLPLPFLFLFLSPGRSASAPGNPVREERHRICTVGHQLEPAEATPKPS